MDHEFLHHHVATLIAHADLLVNRYNLNRMQIALLIGQKKKEYDYDTDSDSRGGLG